LDENYTRLTEIGSGTYGCVYKAENRKDGKIVALKKMSYLEDNKY
jgi:serine/threonine protein kinase